MPQENCRALVSDCSVGRDVESWSEFDRRFGERLVLGVRRGLRRVGRRPLDADIEDYVQEVYCRLLQNDGRILRLCRGETERQIGNYLQVVAERVALDMVRSERAEKRGREQTVASADSGADLWPDERRTTSPEEHLLSEERRKLFFAKCRGVVGRDSSRRDLYILYLALFEGCSSPEISERLGGRLTSVGVDTRISRMRDRLRRREGIELPRRGQW